MGILSKLKTVFRGDISIYDLPHEALRRRRAAVRQRTERNALDALNEQPARLLPEFAKYSSEQMLEYFKTGERPSYRVNAKLNSEEIVSVADRTADSSRWELMGFGPMRFNGSTVWRLDPISAQDWGLAYHADITSACGDGSDIRVLWELNRLGHLLALAGAYEQTENEKYAETFFSHIEAWTEQNPYARGANWTCAMEVALRACNVIAAFQAFCRSSSVTSGRLNMILVFFDQHGRFTFDNNEFSYIATSNHYLSDVVGLFWMGTLMPELMHAAEWRDLGLRELLREMDKQVLMDGGDFEASTGYHRFVTEMLLHTFHLANHNGIDIAEHYWKKLDSMLDFLRSIMRPDGKMPLVGDCDGSRFLPFEKQNADDAQFLITLAGDEYKPDRVSAAFPNAGIYVLRKEDLYLHFNASDCGLNGRGSHGHNDALSIEVFAHGRPFIVDPGSYAYNLDLDARHIFRSTAYHSTVMVDGVEQNTIQKNIPFVIGNEAKPRTLEWSPGTTRERVSAEHYGYRRLKDRVTHRRTVEFNKDDSSLLIADDLQGDDQHQLNFSFHLAPGLSAETSGRITDILDEEGRHLLIGSPGFVIPPNVVDTFFARNYGEKAETISLVWSVDVKLPFSSKFFLVPAVADNLSQRLELMARFTDNS